MKWTAKQFKQLKTEYPGTPDPRKLAEKLGNSYKAMTAKAKILGLKREFSANTGRSKATAADDKFLMDNYLKIPLKRMSKLLGHSDTLIKTRLKQLGLVVPREIIEKFIAEARLKPGCTPPNKGKKQTEYMSKAAIKKTLATRFKKGSLPKNTLHDGAITIRHDHPERGGQPYKYIRVSLGKWEFLHRHNWEKVNGKISKGMNLVFKDGDTMNCDITNLELLTHAELMKRNTIHNLPEHIVKTIQISNILTRKINRKLKTIKHEK